MAGSWLLLILHCTIQALQVLLDLALHSLHIGLDVLREAAPPRSDGPGTERGVAQDDG